MRTLQGITTSLLLTFLLITWTQAIESQDPAKIRLTAENFATVEVLSNMGKRAFHLDNTGEVEVSEALQAIFDEIAAIPDVSATFIFAPGIYFLDAPVTVNILSVKLVGNGHGGIDIHGANLASGTIFRFGINSGPDCLLFDYAGRSKAFPSGESPWPYENLKVEIENLTFVGYNNTGVNTADGYSRFRGDDPNFRGLSWYPAEGRYQDVEKEGQRAIVLKRAKKNQKCELLRVKGCYFTDLYVAIEVVASDVSYIHHNWFGQLTYGIRYKGIGQVTLISDNCFADLETGIKLAHPVMSAFHDNAFAYVSKCFVIDRIEHSTITGNTLLNWKISTGAAAYGAFCYINNSENLTITGNSIYYGIESRAKNITVDKEANGRSIIQFDNADKLLFSNNVVNTIQTQTVIRLHDSRNCSITDNIITHGEGGNSVSETGKCGNNYYRPLDPANSAPFDPYIY